MTELEIGDRVTAKNKYEDHYGKDLEIGAIASGGYLIGPVGHDRDRHHDAARGSLYYSERDVTKLEGGNRFEIGDVVTFAEPRNKHWQGGKAKVVSTREGKFSVKVEIIEGPPKNTLYSKGGQTINFNPDHLKLMFAKPAEAVDGPAHYGGKDNPYEVIKVAEAWGFEKNAYLFNALKYLGRAGKKGNKVEDLKKLVFYVQREIALEEAK